DGGFSLECAVRVSAGPGPDQFRLEEALFPTSISTKIDDDTLDTRLWIPPATYHDLIEAETVSSRGGELVLSFRRLLAKSEDRRFDFTFPHEYLVVSELISKAADEL